MTSGGERRPRSSSDAPLRHPERSEGSLPVTLSEAKGKGLIGILRFAQNDEGKGNQNDEGGGTKSV